MRGTAIAREPASTQRPIISSTLLSTGKLFTVSSETPAQEHIEKPPQFCRGYRMCCSFSGLYLHFALPYGVPCYPSTLVSQMRLSVGIRSCPVLVSNTELRCVPAVVCSCPPSTSNPTPSSGFQKPSRIRIRRNYGRPDTLKSNNQTPLKTTRGLYIANRNWEHESPNEHGFRGTSLRKAPSFDTLDFTVPLMGTTQKSVSYTSEKNRGDDYRPTVNASSNRTDAKEMPSFDTFQSQSPAELFEYKDSPQTSGHASRRGSLHKTEKSKARNAHVSLVSSSLHQVDNAIPASEPSGPAEVTKIAFSEEYVKQKPFSPSDFASVMGVATHMSTVEEKSSNGEKALSRGENSDKKPSESARDYEGRSSMVSVHSTSPFSENTYTLGSSLREELHRGLEEAGLTFPKPEDRCSSSGVERQRKLSPTSKFAIKGSHYKRSINYPSPGIRSNEEDGYFFPSRKNSRFTTLTSNGFESFMRRLLERASADQHEEWSQDHPDVYGSPSLFTKTSEDFGTVMARILKTARQSWKQQEKLGQTVSAVEQNAVTNFENEGRLENSQVSSKRDLSSGITSETPDDFEAFIRRAIQEGRDNYLRNQFKVMEGKLDAQSYKETSEFDPAKCGNENKGGARTPEAAWISGTEQTLPDSNFESMSSMTSVSSMTSNYEAANLDNGGFEVSPIQQGDLKGPSETSKSIPPKIAEKPPPTKPSESPWTYCISPQNCMMVGFTMYGPCGVPSNQYPTSIPFNIWGVVQPQFLKNKTDIGSLPVKVPQLQSQEYDTFQWLQAKQTAYNAVPLRTPHNKASGVNELTYVGVSHSMPTTVPGKDVPPYSANRNDCSRDGKRQYPQEDLHFWFQAHVQYSMAASPMLSYQMAAQPAKRTAEPAYAAATGKSPGSPNGPYPFKFSTEDHVFENVGDQDQNVVVIPNNTSSLAVWSTMHYGGFSVCFNFHPVGSTYGIQYEAPTSNHASGSMQPLMEARTIETTEQEKSTANESMRAKVTESSSPYSIGPSRLGDMKIIVQHDSDRKFGILSSENSKKPTVNPQPEEIRIQKVDEVRKFPGVGDLGSSMNTPAVFENLESSQYAASKDTFHINLPTPPALSTENNRIPPPLVTDTQYSSDGERGHTIPSPRGKSEIASNVPMPFLTWPCQWSTCFPPCMCMNPCRLIDLCARPICAALSERPKATDKVGNDGPESEKKLIPRPDESSGWSQSGLQEGCISVPLISSGYYTIPTRYHQNFWPPSAMPEEVVQSKSPDMLCLRLNFQDYGCTCIPVCVPRCGCTSQSGIYHMICPEHIYRPPSQHH